MSAYRKSDDNIRSSSRVRVVPGSSLSLLPTPPPPPAYPPPKPTNLCKIAVVGDACCGKSAAVQKLVYRRYACCDGGGGTNANGTASATSNSVGTSLGTTSYGYEGVEPTLAEYHKKDITLSSHYGANNQININDPGQDIGDDILDQRAVCTRLQLWDMNIQQNFFNLKPESDTNSLTHSVHSGPLNRNIGPLLTLLKRVNGIIIVCRCPLPSSSFSESSVTSCKTYSSRASCSEWPELDNLEEEIKYWKAFLDDELSNEKPQRRCISILLTCADLAVLGYSPNNWIQLSVRMQDICEKYDLDPWKMGTCMDTSSNAFDGNNLQYEPTTMLQRMMQQHKQLLRDLEDDIDAAFIDLVSSCLKKSQDFGKKY